MSLMAHAKFMNACENRHFFCFFIRFGTEYQVLSFLLLPAGRAPVSVSR